MHQKNSPRQNRPTFSVILRCKHQRSLLAEILKYRQTWAFVTGKSLTDPIWWFYVSWLGMFFNHNFGFELTALGLPLIAIYTMTTLEVSAAGYSQE